MNENMNFAPAHGSAPQDVLTRPTVAASTSEGGRSFAGVVSRTVRATAFNLVSWPILFVGFTATMVLIPLGAALSVLVVGLPLLAAGFGVARGVAEIDRQLQRVLLGRDVPPPLPDASGGATLAGRLSSMARSPQRVADLGHALGAWLASFVAWVAAVIFCAVILVGATSPLWERVVSRLESISVQSADGKASFDGSLQRYDLADMLGLGHVPWAHVAMNLLLAAVFLALMPFVMPALAQVQGRISEWLLVAPTRMRRAEMAHAARLEATHAAEARSLAQLERDIHDGPQQRLVRLQMDLARAGRQWDRDPAAARGAMEAATRQAQDALNELRAATRGVAPPILVDRGLVAALEELAGRSALSATLQVDLPRLNPGYETALYFGVTEALTNAAKHSRADEVTIRCFVDGPWAVAEVRDDGVGGAHLGKGTGLAGLERRMTGLGGRLQVLSPQGGPTLIRLEVPCVS